MSQGAEGPAEVKYSQAGMNQQVQFVDPDPTMPNMAVQVAYPTTYHNTSTRASAILPFISSNILCDNVASGPKVLFYKTIQ